MPDVQYPDDPPTPPAIRIEDLLATDEAASPAPTVREGLPRSFRMRADKHYVEMLDSQPPGDAKSPSVAPPLAIEIPRATVESQDAEAVAAAVRAGSALEQSLSALRTSTNLLGNRGGLASTVAASLIKAEAWRATCLLQVSRFLRGEIVPSLRTVQASVVLEQVFDAVDAERRLRGITVDRRVNLGEGPIVTDEQLLVGALSGFLMAIIGGMEASDGVITVAAESRGQDVTFTFTAGTEVGELARQVAGFTRVVAGIGGTVALTENSRRVSVICPASRSAG